MNAKNTTFDIFSGRLAIGDGIMQLAFYDLPERKGSYSLQFGALQEFTGPAGEFSENSGIISLDGTYLWVFDAALEETFLQTFHEISNESSYDILEVSRRHAELEKKLSYRIGFYWESDLSGTNKEGTYVLNLDRIEKK